MFINHWVKGPLHTIDSNNMSHVPLFQNVYASMDVLSIHSLFINTALYGVCTTVQHSYIFAVIQFCKFVANCDFVFLPDGISFFFSNSLCCILQLPIFVLLVVNMYHWLTVTRRWLFSVWGKSSNTCSGKCNLECTCKPSCHLFSLPTHEPSSIFLPSFLSYHSPCPPWHPEMMRDMVSGNLSSSSSSSSLLSLLFAVYLCSQVK